MNNFILSPKYLFSVSTFLVYFLNKLKYYILLLLFVWYIHCIYNVHNYAKLLTSHLHSPNNWKYWYGSYFSHIQLT